MPDATAPRPQVENLTQEPLASSEDALRALAAWDPRIGDVVFTTLRRTPPTPGWFRGEGFAYHA